MTVPQWALQDYPGAERDFSSWLEQQFISEYYTEVLKRTIDSSTGEIVDEEALARIHAMAKFQTLERTLKMKDTVARAEVWQLFEAHERGWFRLLPPEFDTIEELLASMVDASTEGSSYWYDLTFLVKQVIPLLRKTGSTPEDIIGMISNMTKARASVPYLREILREHEGDPEVIEKTFTAVATMINEPDTTVSDLRKEMKTLRGIETEVIEPIQGMHILMDGKEVLILELDNPAQKRALEIATRGLIEVSQLTQGTVSDLLYWVKETVTG